MTLKAKAAIERQHEQAGFQVKDGRVSCDSCQAARINGTLCHERGCRNERHKCKECDTLIPKGYRLCESCANPDSEEF